MTATVNHTSANVAGRFKEADHSKQEFSLARFVVFVIHRRVPSEVHILDLIKYSPANAWTLRRYGGAQ